MQICPPVTTRQSRQSKCPACKGKHVAHTRGPGCKHGPGERGRLVQICPPVTTRQSRQSKCPACKGKHVAHTRGPGCKHGPGERGRLVQICPPVTTRQSRQSKSPSNDKAVRFIADPINSDNDSKRDIWVEFDDAPLSGLYSTSSSTSLATTTSASEDSDDFSFFTDSTSALSRFQNTTDLTTTQESNHRYRKQARYDFHRKISEPEIRTSEEVDDWLFEDI